MMREEVAGIGLALNLVPFSSVLEVVSGVVQEVGPAMPVVIQCK